MRVGLPPAIVSGLRSEVGYIVTLVAPTGDHESISCPQMVFIGSGGTSAWGMTLNRVRPFGVSSTWEMVHQILSMAVAAELTPWYCAAVLPEC